MTHPTSATGFTLVETLIAAAMLVTAFAGLAQLFALSVRFTRDSGQYGAALVAAQSKLETLRASRYSYDENGGLSTDAGLHPSPATSLLENAGRYFEWLHDDGAVGDQEGATYVRRWRITEIFADDPAAITIEVCVFEPAASHATAAQAHACLSSVRVRQP